MSVPSAGPLGTTIGLALALALASACGDSTAPGGGGNSLAVQPGDTRSGTLTLTQSGSERSYRLTARRGLDLSVLVGAAGNELLIDVFRELPFDLRRNLTVPPGAEGETIFRYHTRTLHLEAGEHVFVRVVAVQGTVDYRLEFRAVDRAPEHVSAQLQLGDTIRLEGFEDAADVDEYFIRVPGAQNTAFFLQSLSGSMSLYFGDSAFTHSWDSIAVPQTAGPADLLGHHLPTRLLLPGYTWRLTLEAGQGAAPAGYALHAYPVDLSPENVPVVYADGDTISGETLENPADIDTFTVALPMSQPAIGYLRAAGGVVEMEVPLNGPIPVSYRATSSPSSADMETGNTGRFNGRPVTVIVTAATAAPATAVLAPQPYELSLRSINRSPESLPANFSSGDTLSGESIDYVGDIDEFTLDDALPAEFDGFVQAMDPSGTLPWTVVLTPIEGGSGPLVSPSASTSLLSRSTGSFRVNFLGQVSVEGLNEPNAVHRGAYRLFVKQVNRAPELAQSVLALGDTVIGETIEIPGDVDEFTFAGVQGGVVRAELTGAPSPPGGGISLEILQVITPTLTNVLATVTAGSATPVTTPPVLLPATQTYTIRVRGASPTTDRGGYTFTIE